MEWSERGPDRLGFNERDFKVCDLCGALNPVTNTDCFICGWEGRFHTDRESVRDAMDQLSREHGEITQSLFAEEVLPSTPPRPGLWADVWRSLKRVFCRA
jgi:hypothetical protein